MCLVFLIPFEQLVKDYERGDMARVEWLDVLVFRQIEKIQAVS
jgi:UDP-N-acetylglucosamine transferase subunit ALG13